MRHPWDPQRFAADALASGRNPDVVSASQQAAARIKRKDANLPVVLSLAHLAHLTDVNTDMLIGAARRDDDPYRVFRVKKRALAGGERASRRYRIICVPDPRLMRAQRWIAQNILNVATPHRASFAFQPGKCIVKASRQHAGCRWLLKMDVIDFFESITERQVYGVFRSLGYGALVSFELARLCTRLPAGYLKPKSWGRLGADGTLPYDQFFPGHLPQGAPTSPMLANLAMRDLDALLDASARHLGWTYTRYADDLAFSHPGGSSRGDAMALGALVPSKLATKGLRPNKLKTSLSPPGARKILLGMLVDRERPRLSREFKNNVETHLYALNHHRIGASAHRSMRGFASIIGMRKHVTGLVAFARQVDPVYAERLGKLLADVDWSR